MCVVCMVPLYYKAEGKGREDNKRLTIDEVDITILLPSLSVVLGQKLKINNHHLLATQFGIKMGLSSLPAPSEGVLCVLLVNTALSISIFKGIVRTILHIVGIHVASSPSPDISQNPPESFEFHISPSEGLIEEFRSRTPTLRFGSMCGCKQPQHECCVCLSKFEPESEINNLSCGHLFHKVCLEKWLDYWNLTCPLCRTPLMPEDDAW
ncbi:hypothetical protein VNO78_22339 [Psophocarpus tetragonolobus]|uniref:RING-type domain-containing protein n=1 Tax=Psophocarpus tetragonolobus TaxID=3891 RepID=A0AAN9XIT9_PSOTE